MSVLNPWLRLSGSPSRSSERRLSWFQFAIVDFAIQIESSVCISNLATIFQEADRLPEFLGHVRMYVLLFPWREESEQDFLKIGCILRSSIRRKSEMATWIQRKEEETYFNQLDQMLVQRLQKGDSTETRLGGRWQKEERSEDKTLNEISIEINEELDRLESLLNEQQT